MSRRIAVPVAFALLLLVAAIGSGAALAPDPATYFTNNVTPEATGVTLASEISIGPGVSVPTTPSGAASAASARTPRSMTVAALTTGIIAYGAPTFGGAAPVSLSQLTPNVLGALLALGLVNTFGAYLIFYSLVAALGAARTSMVTYIIPVVGLILGALFLGEQVDVRLLFGAILIVGGIAIVNLNLVSWFKGLMTRVRAKEQIV